MQTYQRRNVTRIQKEQCTEDRNRKGWTKQTLRQDFEPRHAGLILYCQSLQGALHILHSTGIQLY